MNRFLYQRRKILSFIKLECKGVKKNTSQALHSDRIMKQDADVKA